jgi:ABC-type lipoprotein release transport system permease subunit
MTLWHLALRSLRHDRWLHLGVAAGVALTSAILSGSLAVGDSVRASLRQNAAARLGRVSWALTAGDRFCTAALADRLGSGAVPVLLTAGTVATPDGSARANGVQVLGVPDGFWALAPRPPAPLGRGEMALNAALARRLGISPGDRVVLGVEAPGALSRDAPLSGSSNQPEKLRRPVTRILSPAELGDFRLQVEQVPPLTVFVPLADLQAALDKDGRANLLVSAQGPPPSDEALLAAATLADAELRLVEGGPRPVLLTDRVFLSPELTARVEAAFPGSEGVLTYLVNTIRHGDALTPYSLVAATASPSLPAGNLLASDWLAEDLALKEGDRITLEFFTVSRGRHLAEQTREVTVAGIAPLTGDASPFHPSLSPDFPGISDAENNADWDPGMPFHKERIRPKDEDYWDAHRALPKALLALETGQDFWANRFGNVTACLLPADLAGTGESALWDQLRSRLRPGDLGWMTRDLHAEAAFAVARSYDFGGLFAGMSAFLIGAALLLSVLVFVFGVEQRRPQIGLFLALGWPARRIERLFGLQAAALTLIGATLGLGGGMLYTQAALWGLGGAWRDAAAGVEFTYAVRPASLASAWFGTVLLSLGAVWWATRSATRSVRPNELLSGSEGWSPHPPRPWTRRRGTWIAAAASGAAAALLLAPRHGTAMARQLVFFGAGFLLLLAGLAATDVLLRQWEQRSGPTRSLAALGRSQSLRRRGRSLAVVALMASGVFLITAINSLRLHAETRAASRASGTGGFAYVASSSLPVHEDLNRPEGRAVFGLPEESPGFETVQFRVNQGEDASCLNLNRAVQPRVLGVDSRALSRRGAFLFAGTTSRSEANGWDLLETAPVVVDGVPEVPGILDAATAQYALGTGLGRTLDLRAADGRPFRVRIVGLLDNSVLQGSVIVHEDRFIELFPDTGGYRFFLLDAPPGTDPAPAAARWSRQLEDRGFELEPAWERLNAFNRVQNTYLGIFSTLGGLGVLLGTAGLGIVVARNLLERRGQLALLHAVGLSRKRLGAMVVAEHGFLHGCGVVLGLAAGLVSILPVLLSRSGAFPLGLLVVLNALILSGGLGFCLVAARLLLRGPLHDSLRHE